LSTTNEDINARVRRLARQRQARQADRKAAIDDGRATFVSPAEFAERSGVHLATVYRRLADGTLLHKKLIGKGLKRGRLMIYADQIAAPEGGAGR